MRSQRELAFQKVNFSFFGHRNLFLGLISVAQDGKFRIRMEEAGGGRYNEKQITRQCFQRRSSGKFRPEAENKGFLKWNVYMFLLTEVASISPLSAITSRPRWITTNCQSPPVEKCDGGQSKSVTPPPPVSLAVHELSRRWPSLPNCGINC